MLVGIHRELSPWFSHLLQHSSLFCRWRLVQSPQRFFARLRSWLHQALWCLGDHRVLKDQPSTIQPPSDRDHSPPKKAHLNSYVLTSRLMCAAFTWRAIYPHPWNFFFEFLFAVRLMFLFTLQVRQTSRSHSPDLEVTPQDEDAGNVSHSLNEADQVPSSLRYAGFSKKPGPLSYPEGNMRALSGRFSTPSSLVLLHSSPSTVRGMGLRKRSFRGRKWLVIMLLVLTLSSGRLPLCTTQAKTVESCCHTETPLRTSARFPLRSLAVEETSGLLGTRGHSSGSECRIRADFQSTGNGVGSHETLQLVRRAVLWTM